MKRRGGWKRSRGGGEGQLPQGGDGVEKPGFQYHYSREERLRLPGAPGPPPTGGFLKRNRSLTILLLDLLIILILGFAFFRFIGGPASSGRLQPYTITLRALRDRDSVLATVTVRFSGRAPSASEAQERVYVLLSLSPGSGEEQPVSARLPASPAEETVLRAVLPYQQRPAVVNAVARIGSRTVRLRRSLDQ